MADMKFTHIHNGNQLERHGRMPGFTIVELLIVIVVIAILASISVVAYNGIQQRARDSQRLSDLKAIAKAIEMYHIDNDRYPTESGGANGRVGEGAGLDSMIAPYMGGTVPSDPISDSTHNYYYDGSHACGGSPTSAVLFARTMESTFTDGASCTSYGTEGGSNSAAAYHIRLGDSDG